MSSTTISCKELIEMFEKEGGKMKIDYLWKMIHYNKSQRNFDCNIQWKDKYKIDSLLFDLSPFYNHYVKEEKKPYNYKFDIEKIHNYQDPDLISIVIEK